MMVKIIYVLYLKNNVSSNCSICKHYICLKIITYMHIVTKIIKFLLKRCIFSKLYLYFTLTWYAYIIYVLLGSYNIFLLLDVSIVQKNQKILLIVGSSIFNICNLVKNLKAIDINYFIEAQLFVKHVYCIFKKK